MASPEQPLGVADYAELAGFLLAALAFIILIGIDLRKAFKKGAHWVPGRALVLGALTITIMNFVGKQSGLLDEMLESPRPLDNEIVKDDLFMIHTSRVMLCVLAAFFLPGMARPGSQQKWTKIGAIGLTVFIDIFFELSSVHKRQAGTPESTVVSHFFYSWTQGRKVSELSFLVSGLIISITLIWVILLLICAAIATQSIRNFTTRKIPIILAEPANSSWEGVEDQVQKSWIVARSCYPEAIIARSELASTAVLGVTICILSSIVGWIVQGSKVTFHAYAAFWLKFIITILEVIFILIGWAIIGWRLLSSVAYHGRRRTKEGRGQYFRVENYWIRHIVELQQAERKRKRRTSLVWISLKCVFWMQYYVVFISKVCWFVSDLTFGSRFVRKIASILLSKRSEKVGEEFKQYEALLNNVEGLWDQTVHTLFLTNRKSIKQAKLIMKKGNKDGENCHFLIPFLRERRSETCVSILDLDPKKQAQTGLQFLWRHYPVTPLAVEKYFKYNRKLSWKLTAVSLISIIVWLSPSCGKDCLQAYYEAWELIDLVDESDPETDSLLSKAADRLFTIIWHQNEIAPTTTAVDPAVAINGLAEKCEADAEAIHQSIIDREDSTDDWEMLAALNALYKVCRGMECSSGNSENILNELKNSLANVIGSCIKEVGPALVDNCRKWAQDLDKKKLLKAVCIAGKSRGLMEKLEWESNVYIAPATEPPQQGRSENVCNAPTTYEESSMV